MSFYAVYEKEAESGGGGGGGAPVQEKTYTVNFIVNGDIYAKQAVVKNSTPQNPKNPAREGYVFVGWSLEKDGDIIVPDSIRVTSSVTLYAVFEKEEAPEPEVFTVIYYVDGAKYDTQFVDEGNMPFAITNPSKDGYVFKHWSRTEDGPKVEPTYVTITSNTYFYAVFEKEKEEIKYFTVCVECNCKLLGLNLFKHCVESKIGINNYRNRCCSTAFSSRPTLEGISVF